MTEIFNKGLLEVGYERRELDPMFQKEAMDQGRGEL